MSEPGKTRADIETIRRSQLAMERTQLAWWRAGLAALAVGIGVGRVLPELDGSEPAPYVIAGAGFALYGVALFAYGSARERVFVAELEDGASRLSSSVSGTGLAAIGVLLGLVTVLLIVLG